MKKSEMEKLLVDGICGLGQWYDWPPEQIAKALCVLLKPGEGWEPEEPELPKKLVVEKLFAHDGWAVTIPDVSTIVCMVDGRWTPDAMALRLAVVNAMVAAYNKRESLLQQKANIQRCADRSDQLVDRWKGVVEKALAEVRRPATSLERILAILEERA